MCRNFVEKLMLLSIPIPYPINTTKSEYNKLFGSIPKFQKKYTGDVLQFTHDRDTFYQVNSDPSQMVMKILPLSAIKVHSSDVFIQIVSYIDFLI